jgi:hypothetical protein
VHPGQIGALSHSFLDSQIEICFLIMSGWPIVSIILSKVLISCESTVMRPKKCFIGCVLSRSRARCGYFPIEKISHNRVSQKRSNHCDLNTVIFSAPADGSSGNLSRWQHVLVKYWKRLQPLPSSGGRSISMGEMELAVTVRMQT